MARVRWLALVGTLCLVAGSGATLAEPPEDSIIASPNWCGGVRCVPAADFKAQHNRWHNPLFPAGGRDFLDYHRELLGQSDGYRLYNAAPLPAVFAVVPLPGASLEFPHVSFTNGFSRPASPHPIDAAAHPEPGGSQQAWPVRPGVLRMGNASFCGYTVTQFGNVIDGVGNVTQYHGNGHVSIGRHDVLPPDPDNGDMGNTNDATRDSAFYQWHKYVDLIYGDWAVSKYQQCDKSGVPIYFGMDGTAVGAAGSFLNDRRQANIYQGNQPPTANQYGAIPRIGSDIYVGDSNSSNLLYAAGFKKYGTGADGWDMSSLSILNPPGNGWYFSVAMTSSGAPGTAVAGQAVRGGDIFESGGGGANALYRAETAIGLVAAATDELDVLEVDQQRRVQGTNDSSLVGVADRPKQYFTLGPGTVEMPKATSGATIRNSDVLRFGPKGQLEIAVAGATLGLGASDVMDALAIVDTDASNTLTAVDRLYYSLAPGSPALGANSAADIFCHTVAGATCGAVAGRLEMAAATLGLLAADNMDALDVRLAAATAGACCVSGVGCSDITAAACTTAGGAFSGLGTVCSATECPSAPGACCNTNGTCSSISDQACAAVPGLFRGAGVSCGSANCPSTPNDECSNAYAIPYDRPPYYEPPAQYTDNTYAYPNPTDPPYSCADHDVFFPEYGSGTIWYSYDVPVGPGPKRPLNLDTYQTGANYPYGGAAGDTRIAVYYSPSGNCSTLQEVACGDNIVKSPDYTAYYASVEYESPVPGRYYVQVASVGDANRGTIRLRVADNVAAVPTLGTWGFIALVTLLLVSGWFLLRRRTWSAAVLVLLCLSGLVFVTGAGWTSKLATSQPAHSSVEWPVESHIARSAQHPTLIMFANPDCPCTQSSLKELRDLMARVGSKARSYVVFTKDANNKEDLSRKENWVSASSIEGVTPLPDEAAREADLFGVTTSGQVVLYDQQGHLLFSGGIAPIRRQAGDNPMTAALTDAIDRAETGKPPGPRVQMLNSVRACALRDSSAK